MLLGEAYQHAEDTEVIDDPEAPPHRRLFPPATPRPVVGRVPTEELTMQVLVKGEWHRRMPEPVFETSCGQLFRFTETSTRREVLTYRDGKLCEICFTPHERHRARQLDLEAERAAEAEDKRWLENAGQRSAERERGRLERERRRSEAIERMRRPDTQEDNDK
jgi:hypothetical protein